MIKVDNVSMKFNLCKEQITSFKEFIVAKIKGELNYEEFWALQNISFEINKGEILGIIGTNGSGKSTLLKIISGIIKPTTGSVAVQGTIAPMIELGTGFDMELTGKENIYLNGAVLGLKKDFIEAKENEIIEFSELKEFIDVPLKYYSSGMIARLAFAIATTVTPDILIVDEILSVGDGPFQEKSYGKMHELMSGGTTVVYVSHSLDTIKEICNKAVWIEKGKMMEFGDAQEVCGIYQKYCNGI